MHCLILEGYVFYTAVFSKGMYPPRGGLYKVPYMKLLLKNLPMSHTQGQKVPKYQGQEIPIKLYQEKTFKIFKKIILIPSCTAPLKIDFHIIMKILPSYDATPLLKTLRRTFILLKYIL